MAAIGLRRTGYVAGVRQTVQGTGVTPTKFWKVVRALGPLEQKVTQYRNANDRDIYFSLKEEVYAKGSWQTYLYADEGAALLTWALGADVISGVGDPYTHTISQANNLSYVTLEFGYADTTHIDRLIDSKINKLTIDMTAGKPVFLTADFMGYTSTGTNAVVQGAATSAAFTDTAGNGPANFTDAVFTLTGPSNTATIITQITKCTININNNLEPIMVAGQIAPLVYLETMREVSGTLDFVFENNQSSGPPGVPSATGPSFYELAYNGANNAATPSATVGTITNFTLTTQVQASPLHNQAFTIANADITAVKPAEISPDGKSAVYSVSWVAKKVGATAPLSIVCKNSVTPGY